MSGMMPGQGVYQLPELVSIGSRRQPLIMGCCAAVIPCVLDLNR